MLLVNTFLFANARYGWNNNNEVGAGLTAMINPNLDAHYPVLLSVEGSVGGHAVIADGYGYNGPTNAPTLYHHLNLGWSGTATAWYALPLLDTGSYTFTVVDGAVYNVYTNGSGEIISGRVLDQISRPVVNATVTATRTGGGTYSTATDNQGIYALATDSLRFLLFNHRYQGQLQSGHQQFLDRHFHRPRRHQRQLLGR